MKQLTKREAIAFADSKQYEAMTDREIAVFQLQQDCLCIPINIVKKAISNVLGRPIYTHDLISETLLAEVQATPNL